MFSKRTTFCFLIAQPWLPEKHFCLSLSGWGKEEQKDEPKDTQEETGGVCTQSLGSTRAGSCVSAERLDCQVKKWWMYWGVGSGSYTQGWKGEIPVKDAHV